MNKPSKQIGARRHRSRFLAFATKWKIVSGRNGSSKLLSLVAIVNEKGIQSMVVLKVKAILPDIKLLFFKKITFSTHL